MPKIPKSLFLRTQYYQTSDDNILRGNVPGLGRGRWVISRGLCLYKCFNMTGLTHSDRSSNLELQIHQVSPFQKTGAYKVWNGSYVQVWLWDDANRHRHIVKEGTASLPVIPESLLKKPPVSDGTYLLENRSGYEIQIWQDTVLLVSHWWSGRPQEEEIHRLLISHDMSPVYLSEIEEDDIELLSKPWARSSSPQSYQLVKIEKYLKSLICLVIGFSIALYAIELIDLRSDEKSLSSKETILLDKVAPILIAKESAIQSKLVLSKFESLTPYPSQVSLWGAVIQEMLKQKLEIKQWQYSNGALQIVVYGNNPDTREIVKSFEQNTLFKDVTAKSGRAEGQLVVTLTVLKSSFIPMNRD